MDGAKVKLYKNKLTGEIFGFELDGSQDYLITGDMEEYIKPQSLIDDELALQAGYLAKQAKVEALDRITVTTTAGNTFDGRDKDQLRMLAALQSAQFLGMFNTQWKLSNNSAIQVSVEELREALALSIQATGNIIIGGTV